MEDFLKFPDSFIPLNPRSNVENILLELFYKIDLCTGTKVILFISVLSDIRITRYSRKRITAKVIITISSGCQKYSTL